MTELLSPAKNKKTAFSAINYGADAIYIGATAFGARKNAGNSIEDIEEIVNYAHKFYVRVYVTINTILDDKELLEAEKLIHQLYKIGVDAIIIQDMGIIELAIEGKIPPIPIHMSTQCDNRTAEKISFFENIGAQRVILARELPIKQIEKLPSGNIELEAFIHGALCVSYSGQCYLSCANGGRSANRGECAQPCRKKYSLVDEDNKIIAKNKYLLNLKDFNASCHLKELISAGVKSFKIEGRLKDENYVKNVVSYYRKEIDKIGKKNSSGEIFLDFEPNVNKSFNRDFTDYFLCGRKSCHNFLSPKSLGEKLGKITKIGKNYFEINAEINKQDGLCYFINDNLQGCLVNNVDGRKVFPNKMDNLKVGMDVFRNFDSEFEKKLENSKTKRRIRVDFKLKDGILYAKDEDDNSAKFSVNSCEIAQNSEKMKQNLIAQLQKTGDSDFYTEKIEINSPVPFMPISKINEIRRRILNLLMNERLKNYRQQIRSSLKYAQFPQKKLDYRANIHNKKSQLFYQKCGCEIVEKSFESLKSPKTKELMRTKHCLKHAFNMCKSSKKLFLLEENGKKYELKFDCKNCEQIIIG